MLYSTIEIRPNILGCKREKWNISYHDLPHQRENIQSKPASLGFYHYKRSLGVQKAFTELKAEMIRSRFEMIAQLNKEIESLAALELKQKEK